MQQVDYLLVDLKQEKAPLEFSNFVMGVKLTKRLEVMSASKAPVRPKYFKNSSCSIPAASTTPLQNSEVTCSAERLVIPVTA
ncbi:hypothetical protein ALON55S_08704 [Alishewanella longhuensis]